jgi:hypothetical protein
LIKKMTIVQKMTIGVAAFAWLVIGISEEIRFKNLRVDGDTLVVDDVSRRVGIGVEAPQALLHVGAVRSVGGEYEQSGFEVTVTTETPHGLVPGSGIRVQSEDIQGTYIVTLVDDPLTFRFDHTASGSGSGDMEVFSVVYQTGYLQDIANNVYTDGLSQNGAIVFARASSTPTVNGTTQYSGTIWLNSDSEYLQNSGSSIALGGASQKQQETVYARCCGVQSLVSDELKGDFAIDTIFERGVVTGVYERYVTDIVIFASRHGFDVNEFVEIDFKTGGASAEDGIYRIVSRTTNTFTVQSKPGNSGFATGAVDAVYYDTNIFERFRITTDGRVGFGSTEPRAKLDVRGDLRVRGVDNKLSYSQLETIVDRESSADPQTQILVDSSLISLVADGTRFDEQGILVRFGPSSQINAPPKRICRFFDVDATINPLLGRVTAFTTASCDDEIRFFDEFSNFAAFTPSPGSNQGFPSPLDPVFFNIDINRGGNLVRLDDGIPVWAARQDSQNGWELTRSVTILNRDSISPYITVAGCTTLAIADPVSIQFTNTNGTVSAPHTLTMPWISGRRFYYLGVYNDRGDVVGSLGLYVDGGENIKPEVSALAIDDEGTYYFYFVTSLSTVSNPTITLVYRDFDTNTMQSFTRTHPNPPVDHFTYIARMSFNETQTPNRIDIIWDTVITPGRSQTRHGGVVTDGDNNLILTTVIEPPGPGTTVSFYESDYFAGGIPVTQYVIPDFNTSVIAKYSKEGGLEWATVQQAPDGNVVSYTLAVDRFGGIYSGGFYTPNPVGPGDTVDGSGGGTVTLQMFDTEGVQPKYTLPLSTIGSSAYVCKYSPEGVFDWLTIIDSNGAGGNVGALAMTVDGEDNLIVNVSCKTERINIYNRGNGNVYPFGFLKFPTQSAVAVLKYSGNGLCLNYSTIVNKDLPTKTLETPSLTTSSNGRVIGVGNSDSVLYYFYSPDGSSYQAVLNRDRFISGDTEESFYLQYSYQPTYILRDPVGGESYRVRLANPGEVQCYVTLFDTAISQTYDFVVVPLRGSLDLEYIEGRWRRTNNIIRGPLNIDEEAFSAQVGADQSDKTFEIIGNITVAGELECLRDITCQDFVTTSDARLKMGVKPLWGTCEKVEVVEYQFDVGDGEESRKKVGVIAQDVQALFPHAVYGEARLSVNMDQLFVLNVADTRALAGRMTDVEMRCVEIERMLNELRA